jgi:type II secretory pathway pseudopilin PulG
MRKVLLTVLVLAVLAAGGAIAMSRSNALSKLEPNANRFQEQAESLILGLQQYKEFMGTFPTGSNAEITRSINGQGDKRVLILVGRKGEVSPKGEIVDPWGTPIQIFYSHDGVLIRSAGPNKVFEDSKVNSDDIFRTTN